MKRVVQVVAGLVIVAVGVGLAAWTWLTSFLQAPGTASPEEKIVIVPAGATPSAIADLLGREGLVGDVRPLELYFDHFADMPQLIPGEYALNGTMAPIELVRRIASGKVVTYTITIPPGAKVEEIVQLLAAKDLGAPAELMRLAFDGKLAGELGVPSSSLEGYLFPDAYELPRGLSGAALLGMLVARYRKVVAEGVVETARARGLTENELVTIASLIEKTDILPAERRAYAAVLHNRLERELPLDVPATNDYGIARLGLTVDPELREEAEHPWNTLINTGLPPTPIASPGLAAMVAAAEPLSSAAIYMVKRNDGTHVFCDDADCYKSELARWHPDAKPRLVRRPKRKR